MRPFSVRFQREGPFFIKKIYIKSAYTHKRPLHPHTHMPTPTNTVFLPLTLSLLDLFRSSPPGSLSQSSSSLNFPTEKKWTNFSLPNHRFPQAWGRKRRVVSPSLSLSSPQPSFIDIINVLCSLHFCSACSLFLFDAHSFFQRKGGRKRKRFIIVARCALLVLLLLLLLLVVVTPSFVVVLAVAAKCHAFVIVRCWPLTHSNLSFLLSLSCLLVPCLPLSLSSFFSLFPLCLPLCSPTADNSRAKQVTADKGEKYTQTHTTHTHTHTRAHAYTHTHTHTHTHITRYPPPKRRIWHI